MSKLMRIIVFFFINPLASWLLRCRVTENGQRCNNT